MRNAAAADADPALRQLAATRRLMVWFAAPMALLLLVLSGLQYRQRMAEAEAELQRAAEQHAQDLQLLARPAMDHVQDLRRLMETLWDAPPDPGPALVRALAPQHRGGRPDGVAIPDAAAGERWGQVWWSALDDRPFEPAWLRRAAAFVTQARVAHQRAPGFEATWFAGIDVNTSFGYPWIATDSILQSMGLARMQDLAPVRALASQRARARLARTPRPEQGSHWGSPYASQLAGHLVVSHTAPVFAGGELVGEVSLDFRLDGLQASVAQWARPGELAWIVDAAGHVLADSGRPLQGPSGPGHGDEHVRRRWQERVAPELAALALDVAGPRQAGDWVLVSAGRAGAPWRYVSATPTSALRERILPSLLPNAALALALLLTLAIGQWLLARRFVLPASRLLSYLRELSRDHRAPPPALGPRWQLWVDRLRETFARQHDSLQRERLSEARKSAILDHALEAMVSTDAQGRVVEFNPAAEAMFGRALAEVRGADVATLIVPPRFRAAHHAGLARLRAGAGGALLGRRLEMQALRRDGSEFAVEMVLWRSEVGGEVHYTASLVDISERLQARQEIERQRESLRQTEKLSAMGSLLAGVAHELNNPLAIVMGRADLLEDKLAGSPLRDDAQRIREAAERCGRIVRTFLNMARAKPTRRAPLALNDIVRAAADMLGYTLRSHGIALELRLDPTLPQLMGDADQLGQVLLNLLVNAQQALVPTGGREEPRRIVVATGVETRREGQAAREPRIWLRVQDSGPGVPPEVREQLFQPFFTTKAEGLGTGLGLSVSRSLVREHGGDLVLETQSGGERGASFRLSLPISGEPGAEALPAAAEQAEAAPLRLLVVDDEAELAEVMRETLEGAGYEVATAESGAVALALLMEARFDAIVSDLRMPEVDGAELWRAVRALQPPLAERMLFVTGDILSPAAAEFLRDCACPALEKPFQPHDLLAAVRRLAQEEVHGHAP
ncbi:PAS domain S-box protein [Roseateles sp. DAIF2]|uniref:hybrid sensor histidine kinase/response regulator n=1 Tax=Roseateles sp. DAIF2 TaxID=2714952 RepID=UPI0018A2CE1D|nr:ATP-binding protein [Roseateles sp. DAIF2]QPF75572.1 PAS domain S-box protein [Roseateles sp. DAIF2]